MSKIDIRPLKQRMRAEIKAYRRAMPSERKRHYDEKICTRVISLREYYAAHTLLTYVSMPIEVDTISLICRALADGKRVAVPRCIDGTRDMEFYYIRSLDDLEPRTFGVLEPVPARCELLRRYEGSVCIVPALAYDRSGYRLGYGAGYYDRFLSGYGQIKIGLTYAHNLRRRLWHGRYDVPVNLIVSERGLFICAAPEKKK